MPNETENPFNGHSYIITKAEAEENARNDARASELSNEHIHYTEIVFSPSAKKGVEGRVGINCAIKLLDYHGQDCVVIQYLNKNEKGDGASAICVPEGEEDEGVYGNISFVLKKLYEGGKGAETTHAIPPLAENVKAKIQEMINSGEIKIKIITGNSSGVSPFVTELQDRAEEHGLPALNASVYNFSVERKEGDMVYVSPRGLFFIKGDGTVFLEGENFPPLVAREIKAAQAVEENSLENVQ